MPLSHCMIFRFQGTLILHLMLNNTSNATSRVPVVSLSSRNQMYMTMEYSLSSCFPDIYADIKTNDC